MLGLQLSLVDFADHRAEFTGSLESLAVAKVTVAASADRAGYMQPGESPIPGEHIFLVKENSLHIRAGAHMGWRTAEKASE
jgi:hypothetical protein